VVCLHDVCMIVIGVEGADQGEEEPSHYHVAPGMSLTHELSHLSPCVLSFVPLLSFEIAPESTDEVVVSIVRYTKIQPHRTNGAECWRLGT
jgi:cytochrome c biogenesis protein CcdA